MSETDRLRDLLERTAPRSPDLTAPERAAAVVRRGRAARRRDQALVGAATLAVLAAALGVPLALSGGDPQEATPAPAPTVAEPCPAAPVDVGTLRPVPTLGDVVAVRSCPVAGEHAEDPLPTQPITDERAAAFAADVAALPEYVMPSMCAVSFVISSPWALQVQTAGGELVMVGGPQRLCSSVRVAGTEVAAEHVVAAFLGNLAGSPATLACPTGDEDVAALPVWNASFDARTAVAGLMCAGSAGTALTAGEVAVVAEDLEAGLVPGPDGQCFDRHRGDRVLVLADAQGDQVAYLGQTCTTQMMGARGYWTPGPAAEAVLSR